MFTSYVKNKDSQDTIIFGDGNHGKVKGLVKIAITAKHSISNVFLVESLGYNLLYVSQLCTWHTIVYLQMLMYLSLEEVMVH
jgi:Na+-transporting NADH:ubiquinone oxidoreductase subunit NqrB